VFGHQAKNKALRTNVSSAAVLGVMPLKPLKLNLLSVRSTGFPQTRLLRDATGDTYDAAGLVQDAGSAYYVDDLPDDHTFGTGEESAGPNLISLVDTRIAGTDFGPGVPDTNLLQVNYFTTDGSDIVPAGAISPDQLIFDAWRFDVGTTAAGTDKINWTPNPGFTVVDSGFCVADGGELLGCVDLTVHDSDANGVSGAGVVSLGGGDIAGYGVDEMIMYWEIQLAPSCGDGHVDPGEECDDGNTVSGDGCSATCQDENSIPADLDEDGDVDLADFGVFQLYFDGP
jgi:cysteine-rich repeat protein